MNKPATMKICRKCGEDIYILNTGKIYGRVVVDAEPIWIRQSSGGDNFYTQDGRTVTGYQAGDADDDPDANLIPAYAPHKGHCTGGGR